MFTQLNHMRPGILKLLWILYKNAIVLYMRNKSNFYGYISTNIALIIIFAFAITDLQGTTNLNLKILPAILAIIINGFLSSNTILNNDIENGLIERYYSCGMSLYSIIIGKYLAHITIYSTILLFVLLTLSFMMHFDLNLWMICILIMINLYISLVFLFSSAMSLGMKSNLLSHMLCLPMMIPPIIFALSQIYSASGFLMMFMSYILIAPWILIATAAMIKLSFDTITNN